MKNETLTPQQALLKAASYCAYQERCHQEVIAKLRTWGLSSAEAAETLLQLIDQGYVNEERFARLFAGSKFRTKSWGRVKIIQELKARDISPYCIDAALQEIDESDYLNTLRDELNGKRKSLKDKNPLTRNHKTAQYLIRKGFETNLVWDLLREDQL